MERGKATVNGKTLAQIEEELRKDFPKEEEKYSPEGALYFEIDSYEKRLNEVVGILNYNIDSTEVNIDEVAGNYVISLKMTIEIFGDDNSVIVRKSACGGSNVIIVNATGKPQNLKSNIDSATSEAYKNVCKKLGIGVGQMRTAKKEKKGKEQGIREEKTTENGENLYCVRFLGPLNSGNRMYNADVMCTETGEKLRFVLFESEYKAIEQIAPLPQFVRWCKADAEFTFYGERKQFRNVQQIVFKRPAVKS